MILGKLIKRSIDLIKNNGIESAELDVQVLVEYALHKDRVFVITHPEYVLKPWQIIKFNKFINRRKKYEPIAYITGHKEFFELDFLVDKNTLIPRPETEFLVEEGISCLKARQKGNINVLDLGTGSGAIIISLIKNLPQNASFHFYATDISKKALNVARKNAKKHNVEKQINFLQSNLLQNKKLPKKFDLILANLPYVPMAGAEKCTDFEPKNAIFAEDNGAAIIKEFLNQSKDRINKNGRILIELDPRNAKDLEQFAKELFSSARIELKKDLAQRDRYLEISF